MAVSAVFFVFLLIFFSLWSPAIMWINSRMVGTCCCSTHCHELPGIVCHHVFSPRLALLSLFLEVSIDSSMVETLQPSSIANETVRTGRYSFATIVCLTW